MKTTCQTVTLKEPKYVLVTPAKNEEETIQKTIESVIHQTILPSCWVVVDDGSTDRTADIVQSYLSQHGYIRLLKRPQSGRRQFGSKVAAFNAGCELLNGAQYCFIGNLDADISLQPNYYERVLRAFHQDLRLGIAGGMVYTRIGNIFVSHDDTIDTVGGAIQLFRRQCFEEIGGYLALEHGGIDAAAEITARMHGWLVRKLSDLKVYEHRRTGSAEDGPLSAAYKLGVRFHTLGYSTLFYLLRSFYRITDEPFVAGSAAALLGFLSARLKGCPISLPPEVVSYLHSEQMAKLKERLFGINSAAVSRSSARGI